MNTPHKEFIPVVALEELQTKGLMMVRGADRPIALYHDNGRVHAVDNRCPHLGFPLHKGTVKDGILTCHWHHARFDVCSGCAFDLFADDVPSFDVEIREGTVWLARKPLHQADSTYYQERLHRGLEQAIPLIQAKSITGLMSATDGAMEIVRQIAKFGAANHERWNNGMTTLATVTNLLPYLDHETTIHALTCAARRVAENCEHSPARRERSSMPGAEAAAPQLKRWFRHWLRNRERDSAERTLLTGVQNKLKPTLIEDMLFEAINDRVYAEVGHVFDFANKAGELLYRLGWEHATDILPTLLPQLAQARGTEESSAWRDPVDLIALIQAAESKLPEAPSLPQAKAGKTLVDVFLGNDPVAIINTLTAELQRGVTLAQLTHLVAYAAARRLAHFAETNDGNDWFAPMHTFTYANAVHQSTVRLGTINAARGLFHAAMAVYQDRFLNVPSARLPGEKLPASSISNDAVALLEQLPRLLDRVGNLSEFSVHVAGYIRSGHELTPLVNTLTMLVLREDVDFHHLQMLEAGVQQAQLCWGQPEAEHIFVGVARSLAAHCPTRRTAVHITRTALRLYRGDVPETQPEESNPSVYPGKSIGGGFDCVR